MVGLSGIGQPSGKKEMNTFITDAVASVKQSKRDQGLGGEPSLFQEFATGRNLWRLTVKPAGGTLKYRFLDRVPIDFFQNDPLIV